MVEVRRSELPQYAVTGSREANPDDPAVLAIRDPLDQPGRFRTVNQLDHAVRPHQQVAGQISHGGRLRPAVPLDRHQQLVLDLGQACRPRLILTPALELAQGNPELQQPFEVTSGQPHRGIRPR